MGRPSHSRHRPGGGAPRQTEDQPHAPLACVTPAHAQRTPVFQSGTLATPGNMAKFFSNGLIGDALGLLGDVNGNGVLTNADVSLVKAQVASGGSVGAGNFRNDVNANGVITNADVSVTKAEVAAGAQLPSAP